MKQKFNDKQTISALSSCNEILKPMQSAMAAYNLAFPPEAIKRLIQSASLASETAFKHAKIMEAFIPLLPKFSYIDEFSQKASALANIVKVK